MRKIIFVCAVLLGVLLALTPAALADGDGYTERAVPVIRNGEAAGELALRFYEAAPNVPCLGLGAYSLFVKQMPLTLRENTDGTCALVNGIGAELICDAAAGTITVPDWNRFFDLPLPLENRALGWKDTSLSFVRIADVRFEGEAAPMTLDFAKYGIRVRADQDDVYLPLSVVCNIMTDIAGWHMLYNGENLYLSSFDLSGSAPEGYFDSDHFLAEFQGRERPADVIQACYADLCFSFDYFFGHPGKAVLDEAVAEKGLDQALTELGEEGLAIREGLLSPDLTEYLLALDRLFFPYLADGHTAFYGISTVLSSSVLAEDPALLSTLGEALYTDILNTPVMMQQTMNTLIPMQRESIWGDAVYREYGSTAILRLDSFMADEAAWALYCRGEGELPRDDLGNVLDGLRRASENPEIQNVIFDLSCNSGGSPDTMMTILAVTTGQDTLYGINRLTGRPMTLRFEVDANFDGTYDERDRALHYDFNYGVLVTRHAFSCGNLFPFVVQEAGGVTIGEPSSGGSCCVQLGTDTEGFFWMMSSGQWKLTDSRGADLEGGCSIDLPLEAALMSNEDAAAVLGIEDSFPDFEAWFDDALLDELMNAWYGTELAAAA